MSENYVFAVARIRAKERQLLSDADIAQMISMNDPKMIMGLLEEHGWEAGEDGTTYILGPFDDRTEADRVLSSLRTIGLTAELF